ncbi:MAG: YMGG-like glycine zipper-containing protein [Lentilitoribacter sp.]|jgi:hypothetical protein
MKKIIAIVAISAALAGCNSTQQGATIGAATGAAAGALATGNLKGAAVGAAVGAAAGALIGRVTGDPTKCRYSDGNGGTYIAACP